ncbi:MMPL family transporter [Streptomyces sp. NBC_00996]|uniref:MMPL family transporter n=1 Tax=Streptomyces sp. NBC_00996 TaxID=2903710 RepID=UPI0038688D1E|nr:MMPL family transporter [Streptomyces sp. NBC_00996]
MAKPLLTVLATAGVLLTLAVPALDLRLSLPDNGSAATSSSERMAYDAITAKFGPGFNGPLLVVTDTHGTDAAAASVNVATRLATLPGVKVVSPPAPTADPGQHVIQVIPTTGPEDTSTDRLVSDIRAAGAEIHRSTGTSVAVTGTAAVNIDVSKRLGDSLLPFVAIVIGLSLVLLMIVFRSVVIPLKATVGFLLSAAAALGAVVALFSWGWGAGMLGVPHSGPVVSFLPIILIGVLFGLAMDYEVFLVAGMREEWTQTRRARQSVVDGARHSTRVVTAAALIMFAVFAGFFSLDDAIIKPIAFSLAIGGAIDAFAVRMTLVPAVLTLVGRHAWWLPARLDKVLPDLDIEGTSLTERPQPSAAERQSAAVR